MMLGHTGNYKSAEGNGIRTCQALHPHGPLDHGPRGNVKNKIILMFFKALL